MARGRAGELGRSSAGERRKVEGAIAELERVWPRPALLVDAARIVEPLFPREQVICAYLRTRHGGLGAVGHTLGPPHDSWAGWRGAETIPRHARYSIGQRDAWAHVPADESRVFAGRRDALEAFRNDVLRPNDLHWQLRVTFYDDAHFLGFFGLFRPREARFSVRDQARLAALTPALRDTFEVATTFHGATLDYGGVTTILEALDRAAFLVSRSGKVVYANALARELHARPPRWLRDVIRKGARDHPLVRSSPLKVDEIPLWFVQYRRAVAPPAASRALPPSLERVRALMARGLSDKEIAAALEVSYATARTYVTRVLQRLGLHDRRELMAPDG